MPLTTLSGEASRRRLVLRIGGLGAQYIAGGQDRQHRVGVVLRAKVDVRRNAAILGDLFGGFVSRLQRLGAVEEAQGRRNLGKLGEPCWRYRLGGIDPVNIFRPQFADGRNAAGNAQPDVRDLDFPRA